MVNPMHLTGKQILVAGASTEIGQVIVSRLSELGASVLMVDISAEELMRIKNDNTNIDVNYYAFDIYANSEIELNFKQISETYGTFDGFVYCAGTGGVRPLRFTKYPFLQKMMNDNLYSFIEMVRCLAKKGNFSRGGSMVAISSVSSVKGLKSKTAYAASKAALDASIRCLAAELSDKNIRVNSILKGWVTSDMNKEFIKSNRELTGEDDFKKQLLGATEPVELANTVAFLISDATKTITGTSLLIDGGYTL